jgi:hypothetical protein
MPLEARSLGRTIKRRKEQIVAWHRSHVSNGPSGAINNLVERVKSVAFGFRRFAHQPHPSTALRRPTQLDTPRNHHPTMKPEAPEKSTLTENSRWSRARRLSARSRTA